MVQSIQCFAGLVGFAAILSVSLKLAGSRSGLLDESCGTINRLHSVHTHAHCISYKYTLGKRVYDVHREKDSRTVHGEPYFRWQPTAPNRALHATLRLVEARRRGLHDANKDWAYRKGCWILDLNGLCRRGIGSMKIASC